MFVKLLLFIYSLFFPNCEMGVYVGPRFASGAIPGDAEDRVPRQVRVVRRTRTLILFLT